MNMQPSSAFNPGLRPTPSSDAERDLAAILHVATMIAAIASGGIADIVIPVLAYLFLHDRGAFFRDHAREQLNFQLTTKAVGLALIVFIVFTLGVGVLVAAPVWAAFVLADIVCSLLAALKARDGELYRFPMSIRFLR